MFYLGTNYVLSTCYYYSNVEYTIKTTISLFIRQISTININYTFKHII